MPNVRRVEKSKYAEYFNKAQEFYNTMHVAASLKQWNSVGLQAVHCAISTADALLVFYGGARNKAEDHRQTVKLLKDFIKTENSSKYSEHFRKIIALKNLIEYEARPFRQGDAEDIMKHAERFFAWAKNILPQ